MENAVIVAQVVIALSLLNVWLLRFRKATAYRGGEATNMKEEFAVYGLPEWAVTVVGGLKVVLAILLIAGIWIPSVTDPAAAGIAALMLGAVGMHVKVKDPLKKSVPALVLLALSLLVVLA